MHSAVGIEPFSGIPGTARPPGRPCVEIEAGLFVLIGALALGAVLFAVATQALRAARRNPADTLRYD
jgi:hypothetical protein